MASDQLATSPENRTALSRPRRIEPTRVTTFQALSKIILDLHAHVGAKHPDDVDLRYVVGQLRKALRLAVALHTRPAT